MRSGDMRSGEYRSAKLLRSLESVDRSTMINVLEETGIEVRLGPQSVDDARREAAVALGEDPDEYVARFSDESDSANE